MKKLIDWVNSIKTTTVVNVFILVPLLFFLMSYAPREAGYFLGTSLAACMISLVAFFRRFVRLGFSGIFFAASSYYVVLFVLSAIFGGVDSVLWIFVGAAYYFAISKTFQKGRDRVLA